MLAAAKRSTGAPFSICCVSRPVEPNTKTTLVLEVDSKARPSSSNAGVRSEAAATVISFDAGVVADERSLHALAQASVRSNAASANRVSGRHIIGSVKVYLRTTHLVSF